jgi:hypothetical protein
MEIRQKNRPNYFTKRECDKRFVKNTADLVWARFQTRAFLPHRPWERKAKIVVRLDIGSADVGLLWNCVFDPSACRLRARFYKG